MHAVVLCAHHVPQYTVQALRARGKRAVSRLTSRFRVASYCCRVDLVCDKHGSTASAAAANTATTTIHSPTHRWLRQALRIQRCTARPLFTRPARPRRALRSHDYQRAPSKLSVPPAILSRRCAPAASVQSSYLTLSGCQLLSQGRPCRRPVKTITIVMVLTGRRHREINPILPPISL